MDNNIMDRVMEITDKGLREKIEQEVLDAHRQAEKDREVVERAVPDLPAARPAAILPGVRGLRVPADGDGRQST